MGSEISAHNLYKNMQPVFGDEEWINYAKALDKLAKVLKKKSTADDIKRAKDTVEHYKKKLNIC